MNNFVMWFNQFSERWCEFFWHSGWQSAILVLFALAFVFLFRRISAPLRYSVLVLALLKFVIPPFWSSPSGLFSRVPVTAASLQEVSLHSEMEWNKNLSERWKQNYNSSHFAAQENAKHSLSKNGDQDQVQANFSPPIGKPSPRDALALGRFENGKDENDLAFSEQEPISDGGGKKETAGLSVYSYISAIHLLGIGGLLLFLIQKHRVLKRVISSSKDVSDDHLRTIYQQQCQLVGLKNIPRFVQSPMISAPISFGCWEPTVVIPDFLADSKTDLRIPLAHELAHLRRWDPWINSLQNVLLIMWWVNPAIWVLNYWLRRLREDCCDDLAISATQVDEAIYSQALIDIAKTSHSHLTGNLGPAFGMGQHPLTTRIKRIMNPNINRKRKLSIFSLLSLSVLALIFLPGLKQASDLPTSENDSVSKAEPDQEKGTAKKQEKFFDHDIHLIVKDSNGNPVSNAKIYVNLVGEDENERPKVEKPTLKTDDKGEVTVKLFDRCNLVKVWVSKKKYVTMFMYWSTQRKSVLPKTVELTLQTGTQIGGKVVDENGVGIKGVRVQVSRRGGGIKLDKNMFSSLVTWLAEGDDAAITDEKGEWTVTGVPKGDDVNLEFQLVHKDFIPDTKWQTTAYYGVTLKQLRNRKATLALTKGTSFKGTVTDPSGNPISNAMIVWGDQPYWEQGSQETHTDENGEYETQAIAPKRIRLTVVAPGWMPTTKMVELTPEARQQNFQLQKGKRLHLRFVDTDGKPMPNVQVALRKWKNCESLYNTNHPNVKNSQIPNRSDENGDFVWDWAPEDSIEFSAWKSRKHAVTNFHAKAESKIQLITIRKRFVLKGKAISDASGSPIQNFTVTPITYSTESEGERPIVQAGHQKQFNGGEFQLGYDFGSDQFKRAAFRIEAVGYKPFVTKPFSKNADPNEMTIRLKPGKLRQIKVLGVDGKKVNDVSVWLVRSHGAFMTDYGSNWNASLTSNSYRIFSQNNNEYFQYPCVDERHAIIAANADGYGEVYLKGYQENVQVKLRKWARLEGVVIQDGKPVRDVHVSASPIRELGGDNPHMQDNLSTRTDVEGKFTFNKFPPIPSVIGAYLGPWRDSELTSAESVPFNPVPGKTYFFNLGGEGLQIKGKVQLEGAGQKNFQFQWGLNHLVAVDPEIEIPHHARKKSRNTSGLQGELEERLYGSDRATYQKRSHFVKIQEDGTFLINGVKPGKYRFLIRLYLPPKGCLVEPIGYTFLEIDTNDYTAKNNTIDLKNVKVKMRPVPEVGDILPNFRYKDLQGRTHEFSKYRGKYVLLDFWASWCDPCVKAFKDVRKICDSIKNTDKFVVLGMSLDEKFENAKAILESEKLNWSQGVAIAGKDFQSVRPLGVSTVPTYIIVGPDGKIIARDYDIEKIGKTFQALQEK